jgi:pyruvate dehydrogenase E2 component (dihydrolipoamide acetyltransferase)
MPPTLVMPRLSDSMEEATILEWLKGPGDTFVRGEALVEIETDKATVVYEAEHDGEISEILVAAGGVAKLGESIATLAGGADPAPATPVPAAAAPPEAVVQETPAVTTTPASSASTSPASERVRATPVARRTATQLGVSLRDVPATGPGGRVTRNDVERAATNAPAQSAASSAGVSSAVSDGTPLRGESESIKLTTTRATIARRMEAASLVPVFALSMEVDMSAVVALRRAGVPDRDRVPSLNDFVVKAVSLALRDHPDFNSTFEDGEIKRHSRVNVGVAVAVDDLLLVPAVMDADRLPLRALADETSRLVQAARDRGLTVDELTAGTFTVSNLGMFGITSFTAVINVPQVAILAVGSVERRARETAGGVEFRDSATLTLSCDHRAVYGADGARFLGRVRELVESPLALVL